MNSNEANIVVKHIFFSFMNYCYLNEVYVVIGTNTPTVTQGASPSRHAYLHSRCIYWLFDNSCLILKLRLMLFIVCCYHDDYFHVSRYFLIMQKCFKILKEVSHNYSLFHPKP